MSSCSLGPESHPVATSVLHLRIVAAGDSYECAHDVTRIWELKLPVAIRTKQRQQLNLETRLYSESS